ncbi:MAG TPA: hypothetical protein VIJ62_11260 [Rhizomicrobium sp.]
MTNTIWTNPVSGDWTDAGNWSVGVPTAATTAVINASGAYTITISSSDTASSLFVDASGATLSEDSGDNLTLKRGFTLDSGTVILNGANSFGGASQLVGGTLELGNSAALGTSALTIDGGTLVGTANENFSNVLKTGGSFTMAAGDGDTVRLTSNTVIDMNSGGFIDFGQTGDDGVVVWAPVTFGLDNNGNAGFGVNVNDGTLRDGNGSLGEVLNTANAVNIAGGATLGIGGYADTINELLGGGNIASSAGSALTIENGNFSGNISGGVALTVVHQLQLSGTNTYTGGTTVDNGAELIFGGTGSISGDVIVGNGAALDVMGAAIVAGNVTSGDNAIIDVTDNGSIANGLTISNGGSLTLQGNGAVHGNIVNDGSILVERTGPSTLVLNQPISGTGTLDVISGTIELKTINTYSGGTTLNGGILKIGDPDALGTGPLTLPGGGQLMGTATEALSYQLTLNGTTTFSAAHGTTLTLNTGAGWTLESQASLVFGSSTARGIVVWNTPSDSSEDTSSAHNITVAGGTLRAGDSGFQMLLDSANQYDHFYPYTWGSLTIDQGAKLDIAGFSSAFSQLYGKGTIENTGASATVTIEESNFRGQFSGPIVLDISDGVTLGGAAANWSTINLDPGASLTLAAPSSSNIVFSGQSEDLTFTDPLHFTGSITGFSTANSDELVFIGLGDARSGHFSVSYSGDTSSGTLTVNGPAATASITMVGDYTNGTFRSGRIGHDVIVFFYPNAPATSASPDAFDFSAAPVARAAPEASVLHLHSEHTGNGIALSHDVAEATPARTFLFDHSVHDLTAHGHAGIVEALL